MIIDTHCHLDDKRYNQELHLILKRSQQAGIEKIITIGCSVENSIESKNLSVANDCIFFSAGVHPYNANLTKKDFIKKLEKLAKHKKCLAIGECGLDYYQNNSSPILQKKIFVLQIKLAKKLNKTLIVHVRNAWNDCINILEKNKIDSPVVIHCFTGDIESAKKCIKLGCYISFSGIITFKNSTKLRKIVEIIPLEKILIETDAPHLSPEPFRGKLNEPAFIIKIAEKIAILKNIELKKVIEATVENAMQAFTFNQI